MLCLGTHIQTLALKCAIFTIKHKECHILIQITYFVVARLLRSRMLLTFVHGIRLISNTLYVGIEKRKKVKGTEKATVLSDDLARANKN